MKVGLMHYTEDYPKLVEHTARACYQSYNKVTDSSEKFIKGIMAKGHISVASVGNIVFGVAGFSGLQEYAGTLTDLMVMKEINNYIRWTLPDAKKNPDTKVGIVVSMNMLTLLDIKNNIGNYDQSTNLWESIVRLVNRTPDLKWFFDSNTELKPKANQYIGKAEPELERPTLLTEDYTALKAKGLSDYELDIHATVTLNLKVDRATGLQIWRHADMAGGTELSQRYVNRSDAAYRNLENFEKGSYPSGVSEEFHDMYDTLVGEVYEELDNSVKRYTEIRDDLIKTGVRQSRAKEVARAILPNAMTTKIINCRPLRQWKHFLKLRDTNHAQIEVRKDAQAIKRLFDEVGIPYGEQ